MARGRALSDLTLDVRKRADREGATLRFPDSEIWEYINQSIADLRDKIIAAMGRDFYAAERQDNCDGVTTLIGLQADFYELLDVRLVLSNSQMVELEPYSPIDEAQLRSVPTGSAFLQPMYGLKGDNLDIQPLQTSDKKVQYRYIPAAVRLTAPGDVLDGYGGWEEFVILDAARKCATKDARWDLVGQLKGDIAKIEQRIAAMGARRDRGRPKRAQDIRGLRSWNRVARWRRP